MNFIYYASESLFRHRYGGVVDPYNNPCQQYCHWRQLDMGRGPRRGHAHRSRSTQGGSRFYGQLSEISDWIGLILPVVMKQSAIFKNEILKFNCSVLVVNYM